MTRQEVLGLLEERRDTAQAEYDTATSTACEAMDAAEKAGERLGAT